MGARGHPEIQRGPRAGGGCCWRQWGKGGRGLVTAALDTCLPSLHGSPTEQNPPLPPPPSEPVVLAAGHRQRSSPAPAPDNKKRQQQHSFMCGLESLGETRGRWGVEGVSALILRGVRTQAVRFCLRRSLSGSARSSAAPGERRAGGEAAGACSAPRDPPPSPGLVSPGRLSTPPRPPAHPALGAQRVEHAEVILAGLRAFPTAVHSLDAAVVVLRGGAERAAGLPLSQSLQTRPRPSRTWPPALQSRPRPLPVRPRLSTVGPPPPGHAQPLQDSVPPLQARPHPLQAQSWPLDQVMPRPGQAPPLLGRPLLSLPCLGPPSLGPAPHRIGPAYLSLTPPLQDSIPPSRTGSPPLQTKPRPRWIGPAYSSLAPPLQDLVPAPP